MRIAVFGAGSVGCYIGGAWAAAGLRVGLIGREAIRAEIAQHGLHLTDADGWRTDLAPSQIEYQTKPAALGKADVIALTVKSTGTEAAAKELARHAKKGATVISFQNGVSNAATLKKLLPKLDVVHGMVPFNVVRLRPGHWHRATWGDLTAAPTDATWQLPTAVGDRPGRLTLCEDMQGVAWGKLLLNLNNAINALSGTTILEELKQRDNRRVLAAAQLELLELLSAAGIEPAKIGQVPPKLLPHVIGAPDLLFNKLFLRVQKIDPSARSSMSDDLEAGRPTEIDYLNGEVVKLAAGLGREAPVNAEIVALVKQAEAGLDRKWSGRALREHVLEGRRETAVFGY